jgi:hypothetical protein
MAASFPTKTDFVNGDVLLAGDLNQIGENVNDLELRIITQPILTAAGKTLAPGDAGKLLITTGTSPVEVKIPDRLVHEFQPGQRFDVVQGTIHQITVEATGAPEDFELLAKGQAAPYATRKSNGVHTAFTLIYLFFNSWLMVGDIDS